MGLDWEFIVAFFFLIGDFVVRFRFDIKIFYVFVG